MAKLSEMFVWFGRIIIGVFVGFVIFNGLKMNPKFASNPLTLYGGGILGGLLCMFLLFTIFKKGE
jgi:hypothetical protein